VIRGGGQVCCEDVPGHCGRGWAADTDRSDFAHDRLQRLTVRRAGFVHWAQGFWFAE